MKTAVVTLTYSVKRQVVIHSHETLTDEQIQQRAKAEDIKMDPGLPAPLLFLYRLLRISPCAVTIERMEP